MAGCCHASERRAIERKPHEFQEVKAWGQVNLWYKVRPGVICVHSIHVLSVSIPSALTAPSLNPTTSVFCAAKLYSYRIRSESSSVVEISIRCFQRLLCPPTQSRESFHYTTPLSFRPFLIAFLTLVVEAVTLV